MTAPDLILPTDKVGSFFGQNVMHAESDLLHACAVLATLGEGMKASFRKGEELTELMNQAAADVAGNRDGQTPMTYADMKLVMARRLRILAESLEGVT